MSDDEKPVFHRQPSPHVESGPPPYPQRVHIPQISPEPSNVIPAVTRELPENPVMVTPTLIPFPHMQPTVPNVQTVAERNQTPPSVHNTNTQPLQAIRLWDLSSPGMTRQVPSDLSHSPVFCRFDRIPHIHPAVQMNLQVQQQVRMMQDISHNCPCHPYRSSSTSYQTPNMFYRLENQERESNYLRCSNNDYQFSQLVLMENRARELTTHTLTSTSTNDSPSSLGQLPLQSRVVRPQGFRPYIPHHHGTNEFPIQGRTREISSLQYSFPSQSNNVYSSHQRTPVYFYPHLYSMPTVPTRQMCNHSSFQPMSHGASSNRSEYLTNLPRHDDRTSQNISSISQPPRSSVQILLPNGCIQPHQSISRPWDLSTTTSSSILPRVRERNRYSVILNPRPFSCSIIPESHEQISSNNLTTHCDPPPEEIHEHHNITQSHSSVHMNSQCHPEPHKMEDRNDSVPNSNISHFFSVTRAAYPSTSHPETQQSGLLEQLDEPPHTPARTDFQNVVVATFSDLQGNYSELMTSLFGFLCSFLHKQIESSLGSDSSSSSQEITSSQEEETTSEHPNGLTEDDEILAHLQERINNSLQTLHSLSAYVSKLRTQETLVAQDCNIASQSTQLSPQQDSSYTDNKDSSNPRLLSEEKNCLSSNAHSVPAQTDSSTDNYLSTQRHVSLFPTSSTTQANVKISVATASNHQSKVPTTEKSTQTETTVSTTFPSSNTVCQVSSAINTTSASTLPIIHEHYTMAQGHTLFICISVAADIHQNEKVSTNIHNNSLDTQNLTPAETNVAYSCTPECCYHEKHSPSCSTAAVSNSSGILHVKRPLENSSSQNPTKKMYLEPHSPIQATMTNSPNVLKQPYTQSNSHKISPIFSKESLCLHQSNSTSTDMVSSTHQSHSFVSNEPQLSSQQGSNTHLHHNSVAGLSSQTSSQHQHRSQQLQSSIKHYGDRGSTFNDQNYSLRLASLPVKTDSLHSNVECEECLQQTPDDQIIPCHSKENLSTQSHSSFQSPDQSGLSPTLSVPSKTKRVQSQSGPVKKQEPIPLSHVSCSQSVNPLPCTSDLNSQCLQEDLPLNLSTRESNLAVMPGPIYNRSQYSVAPPYNPRPYSKESILLYHNFIRLRYLFPEMNPSSLHSLLVTCRGNFVRTIDNVIHAKRLKNRILESITGDFRRGMYSPCSMIFPFQRRDLAHMRSDSILNAASRPNNCMEAAPFYPEADSNNNMPAQIHPQPHVQQYQTQLIERLRQHLQFQQEQPLSHEQQQQQQQQQQQEQSETSPRWRRKLSYGELQSPDTEAQTSSQSTPGTSEPMEPTSVLPDPMEPEVVAQPSTTCAALDVFSASQDNHMGRNAEMVSLAMSSLYDNSGEDLEGTLYSCSQ